MKSSQQQQKNKQRAPKGAASMNSGGLDEPLMGAYDQQEGSFPPSDLNLADDHQVALNDSSIKSPQVNVGGTENNSTVISGSLVNEQAQNLNQVSNSDLNQSFNTFNISNEQNLNSTVQYGQSSLISSANQVPLQSPDSMNNPDQQLLEQSI